MFNENAYVAPNEMGVASHEVLDKTTGEIKTINTDEPNANERGALADAEAGKSLTDHDVDVPRDVLWRTPSFFYWTKDRNGKLTLAPRAGIAEYLVEAGKLDTNSVDDLPNAKEIKAYVRKIAEARKTIVDVYHAEDASNWDANGELRYVCDMAAQCAAEIIYWKDQMTEVEAREAKAGREISENRWYETLSTFRDAAIRRYYEHSMVAGVCSGSTPPVFDWLRGARSFLARQAASQTKKLLNPTQTQETSLSAQAQSKLDPNAAARAALRQAAMAKAA